MSHVASMFSFQNTVIYIYIYICIYWFGGKRNNEGLGQCSGCVHYLEACEVQPQVLRVTKDFSLLFYTNLLSKFLFSFIIFYLLKPLFIFNIIIYILNYTKDFVMKFDEFPSLNKLVRLIII